MAETRALVAPGDAGLAVLWSSTAPSQPIPALPDQQLGEPQGSQTRGRRWDQATGAGRGKVREGAGSSRTKGAEAGIPVDGARTHPEKAHFELPYRHHVLWAGPDRGSAASSGPRRAQPVSSRLPALSPAAGRNRRLGYF